jgi:hypothetical protein
MGFDEWFNQVIGYSLLSEEFYSDLNFYTEKIKDYYPDEQKYKDLQRNIVEWLQIAYQDGYEEGKKEQKNSERIST